MRSRDEVLEDVAMILEYFGDEFNRKALGYSYHADTELVENS